MRRTLCPGVLLLLAALVSGCGSDADTVLAIEARGGLAGLLFVDVNGDGKVTAGSDVVAPDISFSLVRGDQDTVATGTTDDSGVATIADVPVGSYRVVVDETELGDSLQVDDSAASVTVMANTTASAIVPLQHPVRPIREVREGERGRLVAVEGVALNAWATFGDSTVHVSDSTGAIRAVRASSSPVVAGDSVRVLGRTAQSGTRPVLADAIVLVIGSATDPVPTALTTAQAATARQGELASALVSITGARVIDAGGLAGGDFLLRVNDGSGLLEVLLDRHAAIDPEEPLLPGVRVDVTGVLVPATGDRWQLKPRTTADVQVDIPTVSISAARATASGQVTSIEGVALNGYSTFGDGTVHVNDPTGSIRVVFGSRSFIIAGDSVSIVGTIQMVDGQPVLSSLDSENHGTAESVVEPVVVSTGDAARARGGELDAKLVRVTDATVTVVRSVTSGTQLVVNDGSGALTVVLDRDTGISGSGYAAGDVLEVEGLLVPAGTGAWDLKPRAGSDLRPE